MWNLGLRAHDFGQGNPAEIAKEIGQYGATCIQLALAKSFPFIEEKAGQLSPGFANHVRDEFKAQGINIAVLGCYINPIHPDPEIKEQSLLRFEEHLRFARDFGCAIVGTETGSKNPDCTYHPESQTEESFLELVDAVKRLAKTAEKYGSIVGIEGVAHHHTIHTYDKMVRMLELVDSPNVQVIYDPVNFFPPDQTQDQQALMDEAFTKFGDRIVAIHSKDYILKDGLKWGDLPAGTGEMDHAHLFNLLKDKKPGIQIILEATGHEKATETLDFLKAFCK
ncbi:sugar phosphate isomerase/epimerase [Catenovulum sp. 2E275]|uniref:sugar phosphate isomerase/epimerase family protein n=1 Tax=Catenovulum sp. 2E275 TaxID=2980497 RepID=UPI0021CF79BC|nr:sugar phosphate isomerase/epimerase family protein [Catenovulum sp. 2E275]MCU4676767.1 sugar phosphate isomerase/epimerase [Catenovulum sp. 2E275]